MRIKDLYLASVAFLTLCMSASTHAQVAGRIESMKLLTPSVGWAATRVKLFWTTDGGASWKDITPKLNHQRQTVSSVFFLDASTGWALLSCSDNRDLIADASCFELASTTDAGSNWSVLHEKIAVGYTKEQLEDGYGFSGQSWLYFVDPLHGWELLDIATTSANPSAGEMLRTVDGGKTWTPTKDTPTSDHFLFVTPTEGWIAGGKEGELFVTHDAGDSWQKISLPDPAGLGQHLEGGYGLPAFENERRGFVCVQYTTGPSDGPNQSALALFVSDDGGKIWRQDRIVLHLPTVNYSDVTDSTLIAAHSEQERQSDGEGQHGTIRTKLSLYTVASDGGRTSNTASVASQGAVTRLSFVSPSQGWANLLDRLLATRDAGRSWTDVTPEGGQQRSPSVRIPRKGVMQEVEDRSSMNNALAQSTSGSNVSSHLGFDITRVPCPTGVSICTAAQSLTVMQAWMNSSPFYDTSVYLPGSPNRGKDAALTSAWVQGAQQQGWGFIPIWFGVQSPCACRTTDSKTGACTDVTGVCLKDNAPLERALVPFS